MINGADCVHIDIVISQFHGQSFGKADKAVFGGCAVDGEPEKITTHEISSVIVNNDLNTGVSDKTSLNGH